MKFARLLILFTAITLVFSVRGAFALGTGSDLEFGGYGTENGKFDELRDFTFDAQNNIYVLEGQRIEGKEKKVIGQLRVQKFENSGKYISQFSIQDNELGEKNDPQRIAVDAAGKIYITYPKAGIVAQYGPDGKLLKKIPVPYAMAITVWTVGGQEKIAVLGAGQARVNNKNEWVGGEQVSVILPSGELDKSVKLSQEVKQIQDLTSDKEGNLYALGAINAVYKFDPSGTLKKVIGSQSSARAEDGSELLHSIAVDSQGNLYGATFGNPGKIAMFNADITKVITRPGEFKWADPWSIHSGYLPIAVDHNDRLWAAPTGAIAPNNPNFKHYSARPSLLRTQVGYFDATKIGVIENSTLMLGFRPRLETPQSQHIAYDFQPFPFDFIVAPCNRQIDGVQVKWRVEDMYKKRVAEGQFDLALQNGIEAKQSFTFTPTQFGWYTATADIFVKGQRITSVGEHIGITPHYPELPDLSADNKNFGWEDAERQVFCGLPLMRLHTGKGLEKLEKDIDAAIKAKATFFVQFSDKKDCTVENVTSFVTKFKGKVKYWEIMNEPNFTMNVPQYVELVKQLYPLIKKIDPDSVVMGPDFCGIQLNMYEEFYKLGGKDFIDILSQHDYEGHEGVDPIHWKWKYAALRELMAKYGDGNKPVWQTERAISGLRGVNFIGPVQAVRCLLHRDLLQTLGVPPEHNSHYYLNEGGYSSVPSYVWSREGPHPGALALRTRGGLLAGKTYAGELDFGPTSNTLFMGLKYTHADGSLLILRTSGTLDTPVNFTLNNGTDIEVVDAFGNSRKEAAANGNVKLLLTTMPVYVNLKKDQELKPEALNFGRNMAPRATFTYSASTKSDFSILNNEIIEVSHAGHPNGGTGNAGWVGDLPTMPQTLDINFNSPREINSVILRGLRADNGFCAILDYDLQANVSGQWQTLAEVRTPCPDSDDVKTSGYETNTWYLDTCLFANRFATVNTQALRVIVRKVTHGFVPDNRKAWGDIIPAKFMLHEVEVYGPETPVKIEAQLATAPLSGPQTLNVIASSAASFKGVLRVTPLAGWSSDPVEQPLSVNGKQNAAFKLTPPAVLPAGSIYADVTLVSDAGKELDRHWARINVSAPVKLNPQPARRGENNKATLILSIKNETKEKLSGAAKLELSGAQNLPAVELPLAELAPGASSNLEFNIENLPLAGQAWKAKYTVAANNISTTITQDLAVREWSAIGPFLGEAGEVYEPERGVDLSKNYTDRMGNEQKWKIIPSAANGFVDLSAAFKPNTDTCAYAVVYVNSPSARKALLSTGADDGAKGWLNGALVFTDAGPHGANPGAVQTPVELKAGRNEILLRVNQTNGGWGFYCDLVGTDGKAMVELTYSPK